MSSRSSRIKCTKRFNSESILICVWIKCKNSMVSLWVEKYLLIEVVLHVGDDLHDIVVPVLLLVLKFVNFDVTDDHSDKIPQQNVVLQIMLSLHNVKYSTQKLTGEIIDYLMNNSSENNLLVYLNNWFIKLLDFIFFWPGGKQRLEGSLSCLKFSLLCLLALQTALCCLLFLLH